MDSMKRAVWPLALLSVVLTACGADDAETANGPSVNLPRRDAAGSGECGCTVDGECKPGNQATACGHGGESCTACTGGASCIDGVCRAPASCGPENCKGCCRPDDSCADGVADDACGAGGVLCETCSGSTCKAGQCVAPCGLANCLGCCRSDGTCVTTGQNDAECGKLGEACAACTGDDACGKLSVHRLDEPEKAVTAGQCRPKDCASCFPGCCVQTGTGVACKSGNEASACGGGSVCSACVSDETCSEKACLPNADVTFKLVILGVTVPAKDANGSSWDYLSNPDIGITVRIATTPETVGALIKGPDNTTTWSFAQATAITAKRSDFQKGVFFDVVDRDTPDPDDPIGTVPASAYVPPDAAFVANAGVIEQAVGELKVRFLFARE